MAASTCQPRAEIYGRSRGGPRRSRGDLRRSRGDPSIGVVVLHAQGGKQLRRGRPYRVRVAVRGRVGVRGRVRDRVRVRDIRVGMRDRDGVSATVGVRSIGDRAKATFLPRCGRPRVRVRVRVGVRDVRVRIRVGVRDIRVTALPQRGSPSASGPGRRRPARCRSGRHHRSPKHHRRRHHCRRRRHR